jgi:hypothetical protein
MPDTNRDELLDRLRKEVEAARREFDLARTQLSLACQIVPDISTANPDGAVLWQRATARYKRAERAYGDALQRFASAVHDLRQL